MTEPVPTSPPAAKTGGPLWKYIGIFLAIAVSAWAILLVLDGATGGGGTFGAMSSLIPVFAAMIATDAFVGQYRRVPTKNEQWRLILWSFGAMVLWSILAMFIVLATADETVTAGDLGLVALALAFGAALIFAELWIGFAFWPKRALRNRLRNEERRAARR